MHSPWHLDSIAHVRLRLHAYARLSISHNMFVRRFLHLRSVASFVITRDVMAILVPTAAKCSTFAGFLPRRIQSLTGPLGSVENFDF